MKILPSTAIWYGMTKMWLNFFYLSLVLSGIKCTALYFSSLNNILDFHSIQILVLDEKRCLYGPQRTAVHGRASHPLWKVTRNPKNRGPVIAVKPRCTRSAPTARQGQLKIQVSQKFFGLLYLIFKIPVAFLSACLTAIAHTMLN